MIVRRIHIHEYELSFQQPLFLMGQRHTSRCGLVLMLETSQGHVGFGEAAPFPGLSSESFEEARAQLHALLPSLRNLSILKLQEVNTTLPNDLFPSVRFALEAAMVQGLAKEWGVPTAQLFAQHPLDRVAVNALLVDAKEVDQAVERILNNGFRAVKIKVGRGDLRQEARMVNAIAGETQGRLALRLDANRACSWEKAVDFARRLGGKAIEYIEEPLRDWKRLPHMYQETGLAIALDESLRDFADAPPPGTAAFIIKPGIDGGLFESIDFIEKARRYGIKPVLSNPFYSAIGFHMILTLAASFMSESEIMGLGTLGLLQNDFFISPITIKNGDILVTEVEMALDEQRLIGLIND